jgi:basic membrane lipoprotein Med (substrate-binding protein (PBP1-ABC) superfamily)/DNA-binding SARP family transcriptional activator
VGGRALDLGGPKQKAVIAALLLRAGDVVPNEHLVEDVWGDAPPASAEHTLESYVSRLRRVLSPHGPSLERRGNGYRLELGGAVLDSHLFDRQLARAVDGLEAEDPARAAAAAAGALSLWRGAALADVELHGPGRAEARRLDELRLTALEVRIDAELACGHHEQLVGELQPLVDAHPYRERLVRQLMLALYRSGRQVEALQAYDRFRRGLADDLGLQPSPDLQHLSAQLIRHDPELSPSAAKGRFPSRGPKPNAAILGAALALVGAALALAWILSAMGSGSASRTRVALVLPRAPSAGREDTYVTPFVDGLLQARREYGVETKLLVLDQIHPGDASLRRIRSQLREERFDLVLWAGFGPAEWKLVPEIRRLHDTRFVYIDASLVDELAGVPNVAAMSFDDAQAGYLAGYLSALTEPRRVSVVAGMRIPVVKRIVEGFVRGARAAAPGIIVDVSYSGDFVHQPVCERIADRQIDRGSGVVFAAAGTCGLGALSAAGLRGVWGVGADADRSYLGKHILTSTVKRLDRAVLLAVRAFVQGTLPRGGDIHLGLADDAVGITGISDDVPPVVRAKVARIAAKLRAHA